jgi:hypothetical protein
MQSDLFHCASQEDKKTTATLAHLSTDSSCSRRAGQPERTAPLSERAYGCKKECTSERKSLVQREPERAKKLSEAGSAQEREPK